MAVGVRWEKVTITVASAQTRAALSETSMDIRECAKKRLCFSSESQSILIEIYANNGTERRLTLIDSLEPRT
jgi:hypothetical protein